MNIGDIYYLSDQFGPKFIKIISIGDIWERSDNWVYFYRSPYLDSVIKAKEHNDFGCYKTNIKKVHLDNLMKNFTYSGKFKGCIKISNDIIQSKDKCLSLPFMDISNDGIICKELSKEDYRNLKLNKLFE
jgi:hypothetical protein